ncbi:MAG TPA: DUF2939 domain-containing protein [Chthoniobacterales bacterium]
MSPESNEASAGATTSDTRRRKRHPLRALIWALVLLLLIYLASPYVAFWRFTKVLRAKDHARLEAAVDFRSVRESLKQQLRAKLPKPQAAPEPEQNQFAGMVERLAPALIDQLVDAFITPQGLTALLADPEVAKEAKAKDPSVMTRVSKAAADELGWTDVRYAFFTGPRDFMIDVNGTKLRYRFSNFRWILKQLELPLDDLKL